jgi:phosphoglycerate dehydrogenase-like enzyme
LIQEALKEKKIAGAVLDVFKHEPLSKESGLWECENVFITPHCADVDSDHIKRAISIEKM